MADMKTLAELDAERVSTYQAYNASPGIHVIGRAAHQELWLAHFEACIAFNAEVVQTTTMEGKWYA